MSARPAVLRPAIAEVARRLLARGTPSISLDDVGEALGTIAVSADEIDALLAHLEGRGHTIDGPEGARGESNLRAVLAAARAITAEGQRPSADEIARRTGLSTDDVRHALALGRTIAR